MTDEKKYQEMPFLRFFLFLRLNFPKRKHCFSFRFSDVYSQMAFVNICLKYITFRQILLDKSFLLQDSTNISWIRFETVVLYGAKQTDDVLGFGKKTDHIGVFNTGNKVVFVIKNQLFLNLWLFSCSYTTC